MLTRLRQIKAAIARNMIPIAMTLVGICAALRMVGNKSIIFQALAHCLVGWLFGAGYVGKQRDLVYLAWGITAVEVACFVYGLL